MSQTQKQLIGRRGEQIAAAFLRTKGYRLIEANWRPHRGKGELDLVCEKRGTLVIVEVKSRARSTEDFPAEANITARKIQQLRYLTLRYVASHPMWQGKPVQIDVAAIDGEAVRHWPAAIGA
ncbi:YraN family protein [Candidatus Parcubacteria bacterium]|nr:YraN family protein [Candidatus Parcubacteria bacterium]